MSKAISVREPVVAPATTCAARAAPILAAALALYSCGRNSTDVRKATALRETIAACRVSLERADNASRAADICQEAEAATSELAALANVSRNKAVTVAAHAAEHDLVVIRRAYGKILCLDRLDKEMNGITVRAYIAQRGRIVAAELKAMEIAARNAASERMHSAEQRDTEAGLAFRALCLAAAMTGRPPLPDGTPDWSGAADDIAALAQSQPPQLNLLFALGHMLDGEFDMALAELSLCNNHSFKDNAGLTAADWAAAYHLLRAIALHAQGWQPLAEAEFFKSEQLIDSPGKPSPARARLLTACRLALACYAGLEKHDLSEMDRHMAWIASARPASNTVAYLTGRPNGKFGERRAPERCLESDMRTANHKTAAKIIAERLRCAITGRPAAAPEQASLDPFLLPELLAALAVAEANNPESARIVAELIALARDISGPKRR